MTSEETKVRHLPPETQIRIAALGAAAGSATYSTLPAVADEILEVASRFEHYIATGHWRDTSSNNQTAGDANQTTPGQGGTS